MDALVGEKIVALAKLVAGYQNEVGVLLNPLASILDRSDHDEIGAANPGA